MRKYKETNLYYCHVYVSILDVATIEVIHRSDIAYL
jgi:hypothetical protein